MHTGARTRTQVCLSVSISITRYISLTHTHTYTHTPSPRPSPLSHTPGSYTRPFPPIPARLRSTVARERHWVMAFSLIAPRHKQPRALTAAHRLGPHHQLPLAQSDENDGLDGMDPLDGGEGLGPRLPGARPRCRSRAGCRPDDVTAQGDG